MFMVLQHNQKNTQEIKFENKLFAHTFDSVTGQRYCLR